MALINFKIFNLIQPLEIRRETRSIPVFLEQSLHVINPLKWSKILIKLKKQERLTQAELSICLFNLDKINLPIFSSFENQFQERMGISTISNSCRRLSETLSPIDTIRFILSKEDPHWRLEELLPEGLLKYRNELATGDIESLVSLTLTNGSGIRELVESLSPAASPKSLSTGQQTIVRLACQSPYNFVMIDRDQSELVELVEDLSDSDVEKIGLIDNCVQKYIEKHENWRTKLLKVNSPLVEICRHVKKTYTPRISKEFHEVAYSISVVIKAIHELERVIDKLAEISPDRGEYWRNKIVESDEVRTKSLSNGVVGLAVTFGDYAVVEFGPTGNAAYIYKRDQFAEFIAKRSDWKDKEMTVSLPGYTRDDGTLFHNAYGWVNTFDALVQHLKKLRKDK